MAVKPNLESSSPGSRIASANERRQSLGAVRGGSLRERSARLTFPETMLDINLATPL